MQVKLDLFHAVKRVASAASKKHPFYYAFLQDFRLVFCVQGDAGPRRKQQTSPPHVVIANIWSIFRQMHADESHHHKCSAAWIGSTKKAHAIRCLSNIPCGFGTNRNENLHRSINKCLSGHKIGVDLAVALLATSICGISRAQQSKGFRLWDHFICHSHSSRQFSADELGTKTFWMDFLTLTHLLEESFLANLIMYARQVKKVS